MRQEVRLEVMMDDGLRIWHGGWSNADMDDDPDSDLQESRVW